MYPTVIHVHFQGRDRAVDGLLEISLPFPPASGLCIDGLTVNRVTLSLSMVSWHVVSGKFVAYADGLDPELMDRRVERIKKMFVGPWEWFDCPTEPPSPKGDRVNPETNPEETKSDVTQEIYNRIMKRRGGSIEELRGEPPPKEEPNDEG